jgi:hypothetical protein
MWATCHVYSQPVLGLMGDSTHLFRLPIPNPWLVLLDTLTSGLKQTQTRTP